MFLKQMNFFGEDSPELRKKIIFKRIEARYSKDVVCESAPEWLTTTRFNSAGQIFDMFWELQQEVKEHFIVLHLDGKNRIICIDRVSSGSLNQSIVHPREVFKTALLSSAAAIILLHNHPSGDPTPSREDIEITRRLKECGELLGIKVLEHLIIGESYHSFVQGGLL